MGVEWLWRFAGRAAGPRDGAALNLDAIAVGGGSPAAMPAVLAPARPGRRDEVAETLAAKILGAHLANRHQTSYPLTLDLRSLGEAQAALLVDVAACAMAADGRASAERSDGAEAALRRIGADDGHIDALRTGAGARRPVGDLVDEAQRLGIAAHAYAVALLTAGSRSPVSQLFLGYLAARLGLTGQVIGSLNRRFRG